MADIEVDYGNPNFDFEAASTLSTWITGPSEVLPDAECIWQAQVTGGDSPHFRDWTGVLTGSSATLNFIEGTVASDGNLNVTVTSEDGQEKTASLYIDVTPSAEECEAE